MNLSDILFMLDLNSSIDEVRIYNSKGFMTASLSTGHFSQTIGGGSYFSNAFVNHWEIFGDGETGYIVRIEIEG